MGLNSQLEFDWLKFNLNSQLEFDWLKFNGGFRFSVFSRSASDASMNQLEDEIELSPPRMSRWQQMFKRRDQPEVNQADVAVKLDFKYAADLVGSELSHVELEEDDDDDVDPLEKCLETFNKARERMINDVVSTDFVCNEYLDDFDKAPEKLENNLLEDIGTKESIKSWLTVEDQAKRIR